MPVHEDEGSAWIDPPPPPLSLSSPPQPAAMRASEPTSNAKSASKPRFLNAPPPSADRGTRVTAPGVSVSCRTGSSRNRRPQRAVNRAPRVPSRCAEVAELADAPDSKPGSLRGVWVRFPPSACFSDPMRIAMLTGGGDCPGLNAVIRAVSREALMSGHEVVGVREGWKGLVEGLFQPLGLQL